jgi:hypothetical protein
MEYQVPQFIEVESKIVGPLTLKQFIYIAGTGGLCVVYFFYTSFIVAAILSIPTVALGVSLAFYKINGKPFIQVLEAGFNFYTGSKFFLWQHKGPTAKETTAAAATAAQAEAAAKAPLGAPRLTRGKLSELAWSLDIQQQPSSDTPHTD